MTDEARVWGKEMTSSRLNSQDIAEVGFKLRVHLPPELMDISANIPHGGKPAFIEHQYLQSPVHALSLM